MFRLSEPNNVLLINGVPKIMLARIRLTTGGNPIFLDNSPALKAAIKIIGTITSVSTINLTRKKSTHGLQRLAAVYGKYIRLQIAFEFFKTLS